MWLMINASDPDLCGVGSDVQCWIEPYADGELPRDGVNTPGMHADSLDVGDPSSFEAAGFGGGASTSDSGWLASDTSGLWEDSPTDIVIGGLLADSSKSEDIEPGLFDASSSEYSIFSRRLT